MQCTLIRPRLVHTIAIILATDNSNFHVSAELLEAFVYVSDVDLAGLEMGLSSFVLGLALDLNIANLTGAGLWWMKERAPLASAIIPANLYMLSMVAIVETHILYPTGPVAENFGSTSWSSL